MISSMARCRKRLGASVIVLALSVAVTLSVAGHDIPDKVVIQAFVKPEGERLHLIVRLPLILFLNLDLPKKGPGYLDLAHIDEALKAATAAVAEEIAVFEDNRRLADYRAAMRISLPSDQSFSSYLEALSHVEGPKLPIDTLLFWNQGFFDAHIEYPIASDRADFSLQVAVAPGLGERLQTAVRFLRPGGPIRAYQLVGDKGLVALAPRWHQAARTFLRSGFSHLLGGIEHLLFLLCLIIPFRDFRSLVIVVASFTIAHSMTLIAAGYGLAPPGPWFPPLVETLIAVSILYMAIENVVKVNLARRWFITFVFGLVHGWGFSFALRESLQFAGSHRILSLFSFNIGVELGQVLLILLLVPAISLFFRHALAERLGTILLSVIAAHSAWHWMTERVLELRDHPLPVPDAATVALLVAGVLLLLLVSSAFWLLAKRWHRASEAAGPHEDHLPDLFQQLE